jgi:hypothetical protein
MIYRYIRKRRPACIIIFTNLFFTDDNDKETTKINLRLEVKKMAPDNMITDLLAFMEIKVDDNKLCQVLVVNGEENYGN